MAKARQVRTLILVAAVLLLAGSAIAIGTWSGHWCPIAFVRFSGPVELPEQLMLRRITCLEVRSADGAVLRRIGDPVRIRAVTRFLEEHASWWGEHVFDYEYQDAELFFGECANPDEARRFAVGASRLGTVAGKGFARPLCRCDHDTLAALLGGRQ